MEDDVENMSKNMTRKTRRKQIVKNYNSKEDDYRPIATVPKLSGNRSLK